MKKRFLAFFLIFSLLSLTNFALAEEKTTPAFTFSNISTNSEYQGYFYYDSTPGSKIKDLIFLKNLDPERTITIHLNTQNDTPRPPQTSSTQIPKEWLSFTQKSITLEPLEEKSVEFSIKIPRDTEAKEYNSIMQVTLGEFTSASNPKEPQTREGSVSISLGVARPMILIVNPGAPMIIDRTKMAENLSYKRSTTLEKLKSWTSKVYSFTEKYIEIILIALIIGLLFKIAISQSKSKK